MVHSCTAARTGTPEHIFLVLPCFGCCSFMLATHMRDRGLSWTSTEGKYEKHHLIHGSFSSCRVIVARGQHHRCIRTSALYSTRPKEKLVMNRTTQATYLSCITAIVRLVLIVTKYRTWYPLVSCLKSQRTHVVCAGKTWYSYTIGGPTPNGTHPFPEYMLAWMRPARPS